MERRNVSPLPCCCQILVSEKFLRRAGAGEEAGECFPITRCYVVGSCLHIF